MQYYKWKQRVRKSQKDDVLVQSSYLNWKAWDLDAVPAQQRENATVVNAFMPRVFAVAGAHESFTDATSPRGTDVFQLAKDIIEIDETVVDQAFLDEEKRQYAVACAGSEILAKYRIDHDIVEFAAPIAFMLRSMRAQHDSRSFSLRHVVRAWLIYQKLDVLSNGVVERFITTLLRLSAKDAFRSSIALFSIFHGKTLDYSKAFLSISGSNFEDDLRQKFNIDKDTLALVASRLSLNPEKLAEWHREVMDAPAPYQKYFPLPFYSHPLLEVSELGLPFESSSPGEYFACPCPYLFLAGAASFVFRLLDENRDGLAGFEYRVELGYAVERYLHDVLLQMFSPDKVTRIQNPQTRNADFLIELDCAILAVECKRTIGNRVSRTIVAPDEQVKVWEKFTDALEQCAATLNNLSSEQKQKPLIPIIVADENFLGEEALYALFALKSNILTDLNLNGFEILSLDQFEMIFSNHDHTAIVAASLSKWKTFHENPNLGDFKSLSRTAFDLPARANKFRHLYTGFETLFPNSRNPFEVA